MTDRDPTPHKPTCPLCGDNARVERERDRWLCVACWTVFMGSQDEWNRMREARENRSKRYAKEAVS